MDPFLQDLLTRNPPALLNMAEGRRIATRVDPALFAFIYLRHHLKDAEGQISYAEAHVDWYRQMTTWVRSSVPPRGWRRAYIAPRDSAKSTHWYLFAPLWGAAHGHTKFVACYSDSATQAETHLSTLKHELETNELLRHDFPDLCKAARRPKGQAVSDSRQMLHQKNDFVMSAKGIDAGTLGLKVGERRPDVILLDDIEKGEASYSLYQAQQRLKTLQDVVLPLNERARTVLVGTVTMPGSLIHQMQRGGHQWVRDEKFEVHHYLPVLMDEDGTERSLWPAKWPLDYLHEIQHTRGYAKNFLNQPINDDGDYWSVSDIKHEPMPFSAGARTVLTIDPAVTEEKTSDTTAYAVASQDGKGGKGYLRYAVAAQETGRNVRRRVESLLVRFPEIRVIVIEVRQGGDLWVDALRGLPVKIRTTMPSAPKHIRAGKALELYQTGKFVHATGWDDTSTIEQLTSYPKAPYDDLVDAVGSAARYLCGNERSKLVVAVA